MINITRVSVDAILALRQAVLRPGHAIEACTFKEDLDFISCHFAVYRDSRVVACLSLYGQSPTLEKSDTSWRLRGMAVAPSYQNQGLGSQLLKEAIQALESHSAESIWCNARQSAIKFYPNHGFDCLGEPFEIPGIGSHIKMHLKLGL